METSNYNELKEKTSEIRGRIINDIKSFNSLKAERDKLNLIVKENKEKREAMVNTIKTIISQIKALNEEKKNFGETEDARTLRQLIDKKEWFFQINVMSMKKEESIMKELKGLKNKLKEADKKGIVYKNLKKLIHELGEAREKHNEFHNNVITNAEASDKISKQMKELQKSIKTAKKEGKSISDIIGKESFERRKSYADNHERSRLIKEKEEMLIKQKQDEVLEKLKNKKKLTNEDLVLFQ